ncbi:MAG: peptide-methionine (S)-S-oxide reductase MsrA [Synoicihabitans sp.]
MGLVSRMSDESSSSGSLVLGGGCFWCTEAAYRMVPGVTEVVSGYAGGEGPPNYEAVCSGTTGHAEVVRIHFDPAVVSLAELFDLFWKIHDPTTLNRQGADVGTQYRSTIMVANAEQRTEAEASMERAKSEWGDGIVTEIVDLPEFHVAEEYHQHYYDRNPEAGFCQMVIRPKLDKVQQQLAGKN